MLRRAALFFATLSRSDLVNLVLSDFNSLYSNMVSGLFTQLYFGTDLKKATTVSGRLFRMKDGQKNEG